MRLPSPLSSRLSPRLRRRAAAAALAGALVAPFVGPIAPVAAAGESHPIVFPVDGPVRYTDDFGAPRAGGRTHQGNDLMGYKLEHEVAAADGVISFVRIDGTSGISGNMLSLKADDGWFYYYIHINNDTPGTDDGANPPEWRFAPGITAGSRVVAGQFVAFLGDSGDAETTAPHLHFEVHQPDGTAIDPYPSLQAAPHFTVTGKAVALSPVKGYYVMTGDGNVHSVGGAPNFGFPTFPGNLARSMAVMPDGQGYVVLDALGGLHKFGSAVTALAGMTPPYFGFDIARSVALTPSGKGFAILDGWGAVHTAGDAGTPPSAYWPGWDIARSVAFTSTGLGMYVLDGFGGVHTSGDALAPQPSDAYWVGWDIARTIVAAPTGKGYGVIDGFGALHGAGTMPAGSPDLYVGFDRWRNVAFDGKRWAAVDGYGGSTALGAPAPPPTTTSSTITR